MTNQELTALDFLKNSTEIFVNAEDIAPILGSKPQDIRNAAKKNTTGFPVVVLNNRVKIPRVPFLKFIGE